MTLRWSELSTARSSKSVSVACSQCVRHWSQTLDDVEVVGVVDGSVVEVGVVGGTAVVVTGAGAATALDVAAVVGTDAVITGVDGVDAAGGSGRRRDGRRRR